ncbi:MAG TPA: Mth938-like domain-containing protein [Geobacteraceae bacterium]|nr:Mth938-like domain-containing protein [Geobacteraceae bacterium]
MQPKIDGTEFGSITIGGKTYDHDVLIRLSGGIEKRKKKLSKAVYGTSHTISLDEAKFVYEKDAEKIIIGSGQSGNAELSEEAEEYFRKKKCKVVLLPTPEAIDLWNDSHGPIIGLFHVTC